MKRVHLIGIALMAAFAMAAVAASAASAHEWLEDGSPIASALKVNSKGTLELTDSKTTIGSVTLECTGVDVGTIGPDAADKIEKVEESPLGSGKTKIKCTSTNRSCGSPEAEAVHLPWNTEIQTVGTETRDVIKNSGAGVPGWAATCTVIGIKVTDTCTAESNTALADVSPNVEAIFDAKSPKATCSQSGEATGSVLGVDLIEAPSGHTIGHN